MRQLIIWTAFGIMSCAGNPPSVESGADKPPLPPTTASESLTLEKAPESGTVDRVGASDGALAPDGTNDLAFVARGEGPVSAVFLVAVDAGGKPAGTFQADTLVGADESPSELGAKPGSGTLGLGVFEGAKMLNGTDGSLQAVGAGAHDFVLYVAPSPALTPGMRLRVYLQRPDKTLIAGAIVTNP